MPDAIQTLDDLLEDFIEHCQVLNFTPRTIRDYTLQLRRELRWWEQRYDIRTADRLGREHIEAWLRYTTTHRTPKGLPMRIKTVHLRVAILRSFLKHLNQAGYICMDLLDALVYPKGEQLLPASVMTHAQVRKLMNRVNTGTPLGYRDRAILELLYTSGIRAAELLGLNVGDVDIKHATARVLGKGRKERVVPIGKTALRYLETYLVAVRPFMTRDDPNDPALFISYQGERLTYTGLRGLVHRYADPLGLDVPVSVHTFRRTCTTELIRGGANVYHVKELLGHESLDMLKPYTKLTIQDLKKTHEKCHPRERQDTA
jgi:site-specific recombinase XerD